MADKYGMKQAIETLADTIRTYPYLAALLGFGSVVSFGIVKLLALLETVQG